jgi:hypothetical protein
MAMVTGQRIAESVDPDPTDVVMDIGPKVGGSYEL